jgi:hypothetical protein
MKTETCVECYEKDVTTVGKFKVAWVAERSEDLEAWDYYFVSFDEPKKVKLQELSCGCYREAFAEEVSE